MTLVRTRAGKRTKFRLYVRPSSAPKWWPRDKDGYVVWTGMLEGGNAWIVGDGPLLSASEVARAKLLCEVRRPRRFRVVEYTKG